MAIDAETGEQTAYDAQDTAEVFDEDNLSSDGARIAGRDGLTFEEMPDVYDVTRAIGDDDDDEAVIGEDLDDSEIVSMSLDNDQDDADPEDDDLRLRDQDAYADEDADPTDLADDNRDERDKVGYRAADEVGLHDAGDLNDTQGARSGAQRYESARVSDEDLAKLGYAKPSEEKRAFSDKPDSDDNLKTDRTPEGHAQAKREDELLDEGIEETFPASDPVSVKHIS